MNDRRAFPLSSRPPVVVYNYRPGSLYLNITNRCINACDFCSLRINQGQLGPFNLNLGGSPLVPIRVHPQALNRNLVKGAPLPSDDPYLKDAIDAEPSVERILMDLDVALHPDSIPIREVVFCGAGEPTIRLDTVLEISTHLKSRGVRIRINTNGHAGMIHGNDAVAGLKGLVDEVSVSLNAQDAGTYTRLSHPAAGEEAFTALLDFSSQCAAFMERVTLSVVTLGSGDSMGSGIEIDIPACKDLADKMGTEFRLR